MVNEDYSLLVIAQDTGFYHKITEIFFPLFPQGSVHYVAAWEEVEAAIAKHQPQAAIAEVRSLATPSQWIPHYHQKIPLILAQDLHTPPAPPDLVVQWLDQGADDYLSLEHLTPQTLVCSLAQIQRHHLQGALMAPDAPGFIQSPQCQLITPDESLWTWNFQEKLFYVDPHFWQFLGSDREDSLVPQGQIKTLCHPRDWQKLQQSYRSHLKDRDVFELELRLRHGSGEYLYFLLKGQVQVAVDQVPVRMTGIIKDVTKIKRSEERRRFLTQANGILIASLDFQTTLENLAWLAIPRIADFCVIEVNRPEKSYLAISHVDPIQEQKSRHFHGRFSLTEILSRSLQESPPLNTVKTCWQFFPKTCEKFFDDPQDWRDFVGLKLSSYTIIPLRTSSYYFGSIILAWTDLGRSCTHEDVALAEELAARATWALENNRLYSKSQIAHENLKNAIAILQNQKQQLQTLQQLNNLLNQRLTDIPDLLRVMAQHIYEAIGRADVAWLTLSKQPWTDRPSPFTVTAGQDGEKLRLNGEITGENGLFSQGLRGQRPLLLNRKFSHHPHTPESICIVGIHSLANGPLGVLAVANWQLPHAFSEDDLLLLTGVAEQAAIAIDNARLIKTLASRESRLERQNEMLEEKNKALKKQQKRIELQNLQLMEASKIKSQFLAAISHELRTPMNSIIGFSQLLLQQQSRATASENSPQQQRMLERILNNAQHLLGLINDLLDFSKIKTTELRLAHHPVNLAELGQSVISELCPIAEQKHLTLSLDCRLENVVIVNDSLRLRQVLFNLVSNSVKFTDRGEVALTLAEIPEDRIVIEVKDTGIGIAPEYLSHIFDEFWQVDQTFTKQYYGTGLGLAITKSLVDLMGGKIKVLSEVGAGTTIALILPRKLKKQSW